MKNLLHKSQLWHQGLFLLAFLLISPITFAQKKSSSAGNKTSIAEKENSNIGNFPISTPNPEVDRQSDENTDILNVEVRENETMIRFSYIERGQESVQIGNRGMEIIRTPHSISINPESYLRIGSKKYAFIKATGLPLLPNETSIAVGEKVRFTVYFERLEAGEELFDFIEGKNSEGASRHFWTCACPLLPH